MFNPTCNLLHRPSTATTSPLTRQRTRTSHSNPRLRFRHPQGPLPGWFSSAPLLSRCRHPRIMRSTQRRHPCRPLLPSPSQTHRGRTTLPTRRPHGLQFPIGCSIHGCSIPRCPARLLLPSRPVLPPTSHHKHRLRRSLCGLSRVPSRNGERNPHHRRRSRVREAILEARCQRVRRTNLLVQYLLMRRPRPPWPGHRYRPPRLPRLPASHRPLHRQLRRRRLP